MMVRHVREPPSAAFQSPTAATMAEFACPVVSASDGAPEDTLVLDEFPTPAEPENRSALYPQYADPDPDMVMDRV